MNHPIMSPAELDCSVYKLVAKEFGVANAMRFIARHAPSAGSHRIHKRSIVSLPNPTLNLRICLQRLARKKTAVKQKFRTGDGEHGIARITQSLYAILDSGAMRDSRRIVNLSHARKAPPNPAQRIK